MSNLSPWSRSSRRANLVLQGFLKMAMGCALVETAPAAASSVAALPLQRVVKQVEQHEEAKTRKLVLSTLRVHSRPKKKSDIGDKSWQVDEAWLTSTYDQSAELWKLMVNWSDYGRSELPRLNVSRYQLPGGKMQPGPKPVVVPSTECVASYTSSDQYGIVYEHHGGCFYSRSYAIPITEEVLRHLARLMATEPGAAFSIALDGLDAKGNALDRMFVFYPVEALALVSEMERVEAKLKAKP